jgi:hypothetical protein
MSASHADPLRATLYLRRNVRTVLPVVFAVALTTSLLVLVITPTNTFRRTQEVDLAALDQFTVVAPLREADFEPALLQVLDANPDQERRVTARVYWVRYPMLVGEAFCPLLLVDPGEWQPLLARLGVALAAGRLPEPGTNGIVLHRDVAAARGLALGDRFGAIVDPDDATPGEYTVVGLLAGATRVGLGDYAAGRAPAHFVTRTGEYQLVFALPGAKTASDEFLHAVRRDDEAVLQVIDRDYVRRRTDEALRNLPLLQRSTACAAAAIVALVMVLLEVITFRARLGEFGILLAVGHTRRRLARKLFTETAVVSVTGWLVGLALGYAGLTVWYQAVLRPRGILVDVTDPNAALITIVLPLASVAASALALRRQLQRVDPVAILQGRWR